VGSPGRWFAATVSSTPLRRTVFTWTQDDSLRWPRKNKSLLRKKYFTVNFIHLVHKACQILHTFTNQCHSVHLHSRCRHLPHTHSQYSLSSSLPPVHNIPASLISCTGYTALLKSLHSHFWWDTLLCCYDKWWLNKTRIFLGFQIYLNPWWRFIIFSTDGFSGY